MHEDARAVRRIEARKAYSVCVVQRSARKEEGPPRPALARSALWRAGVPDKEMPASVTSDG
eukprot:5413789-Lingulodinium_polyedra.AAC.1